MSISPPRGLRSQIPTPLTSLVGRDLEIEALTAFLLRDEVRLVTITGPGGVGKTRLALAVLASVKNSLPAQVHVISLVGLTQGTQLIPFIAQSLGARAAGSQDPQALLRALLRGQRTLLVLDNFEHILDGAPALGELLAGCPALTALVTSRALLRIAGEQAFPLFRILEGLALLRDREGAHPRPLGKLVVLQLPLERQHV